MSNVVYLCTHAQVAEIFQVENHGEQSWWIFCQPMTWDGIPMPTSRPMFFSRNREKAQAYADLRNGVLPLQQHG